jgi:hypothetical protein
LERELSAWRPVVFTTLEPWLIQGFFSAVLPGLLRHAAGCGDGQDADGPAEGQDEQL